ncbi:MAG TPA: hypothetical protein VFQ53_06525 [Kofleriaceae bacterium]|nr:hypothetical protein [Kofleriaceae bacterium]
MRSAALGTLVGVALVAIAAGCQGAAHDVACSQRCTSDADCTAGTCSAGFCAADGETCEPSFERVEAGGGFACALDQFHRLWCWGSNADHQIDSSDQARFDRAVVVGERRWDAIALGGGHICGLEDGELWCWGRNDRAQVSGMVTGDVVAPLRIEVPGETVEWNVVSAGVDDTCGIANHRLYCWGAGDSGKLGLGDKNDARQPRIVAGGIADWTTVATGLRHTCALSAADGLYCWGDGSSGQLGTGRFTVHDFPQKAALADAKSVALGLHSTCVVTRGGELACFGRAFDGALGDPALIDPDGENRALPTRASELSGWTEVVSAERYTCGRRDGEIYCWGSALAGGLGNGHWIANRAFGLVLDGATDLAVGWNGTDTDAGRDAGDLDLTCALVDGAITCWGDNREAQLGRGGATRTAIPTPIAGDHSWQALAAGPDHACGLAGGEVWCWGSSERGQVSGVEAGGATACTSALCDAATPISITSDATTLAIGRNHSCALHDDAATCWGDNRSGQCGGLPEEVVPPRQVSGAWSTLYAGANATCATMAGETWCWGMAVGTHAPASEPALANTSSLAFGATFGCALSDTGALGCFGSNTSGAFGNGGAGTCGDNACNANETSALCPADCGTGPVTRLGRRYNAIAAGWNHVFACGIRLDQRVECWGDNTAGQVGLVNNNLLVTPVPTPFILPNLTGCTELAAGDTHACAICNGQLACWGDASDGQLAAPVVATPVVIPRVIAPVTDGDPWTQVTAGVGYTCARTQAGHGFCWGTSRRGALGNGGAAANLPGGRVVY